MEENIRISSLSAESSAPPPPPPPPCFPQWPSPMTSIQVMTADDESNPMRKNLPTLAQLFGDFGKQPTKLNNSNQEDWLPITQSRNGNAFYAAFHVLSSGIGFQALLLPLAFTSLSWKWGITCLGVLFVWQLYTIWLLIQLHEPGDGTRYSRYIRLSIAAFGEKRGKVLCLFPIMYLSGGSCVSLIMVAGSTLKILFQTLCGYDCELIPPTTGQWYLVFTCCAVIVAQLLPNLNSVAKVSLLGALTAIAYCTLLWVVPVREGWPKGLSYDPVPNGGSKAARICTILDSLGMIALAFRGHNLILEIQGTMPTSKDQPSRMPMWRAVKFAYFIIGLCLFSLAMGGYWAYGDLITQNEGMLKALRKYHGDHTSKFLLAFTSLLVVINCLSSFQIYAMPVFDNFEFQYTSRKKNPCPGWLRKGIRVFFGCLTLLISVTFPFLLKLAGLIGGISLPITLAYPCLMWVKIKKPEKWSFMWWFNWLLGCLGILLSVVLVGAAIWSIVLFGLPVRFFKTQ